MATRYIAGRVLALVPVLFIVSVVVSLMVHLTPGDPVKVMMGQSGASAEQIEQVRRELGLDQPLPVQYVRFVQDLVTGNLRSIRTHQPVVQQYLELFPNTLQLAVVSLAVATVIGLILGVVAATHQNSWLDSFSMAVSFLGVSIPNFWLALVLIYVFAVTLNWLPATGAGGPKLLILPATVLAMEQVALIARLIRANMVEVLQEDYIKTARSKGLTESSVQLKHALRNAMLPTITLMGLNFGYLLSGAIIVETVFARPGIGRLIVDAILNKDFPVVQGAVLLTAAVYLLVNLLTDVSYSLIDPRIRY
jgi:ABC-type dipeptide/oligopeptide/nickel transport system permease component